MSASDSVSLTITAFVDQFDAVLADHMLSQLLANGACTRHLRL